MTSDATQILRSLKIKKARLVVVARARSSDMIFEYKYIQPTTDHPLSSGRTQFSATLHITRIRSGPWPSRPDSAPGDFVSSTSDLYRDPGDKTRYQHAGSPVSGLFSLVRASHVLQPLPPNQLSCSLEQGTGIGSIVEECSLMLEFPVPEHSV